jgi:uncharacterized membrane protein
MDLNFRLEARKGIVWMLLGANLLLLLLGWIVAFYTYPRLPQQMPLWLNFFGQEVIKMNKSPLFFCYPLAQTLFFVIFWLLSRIEFPKVKNPLQALGKSHEIQSRLYSNLMKEMVFLVLIFFNLIFIHIQRSLILLAYGVEKGVRVLYFYSLFGIILALIPLYKIRAKIMAKMVRLSE